MNHLNQYKITKFTTMQQTHTSNQTNQNCSSRFHQQATPTLVDRIVFPQMVNDAR